MTYSEAQTNYDTHLSVILGLSLKFITIVQFHIPVFYKIPNGTN